MRIAVLTSFLAMLLAAAAVAAEQPGDSAVVHAAALHLLEDCGMAPADGEAVKCGFPAVMHGLAVRGAGRESLARAAGVLLARPTMQTSRAGGGFRVHFDTAGVHAAALLDTARNRIPGTAVAFAESVLASLAFVAPIECVTLGYGSLRDDGVLGGGPEYDVYVMDLANMYGYTTPDGWPPDGGTATTFITIDNDFAFVRPVKNRGIPGMQVTVAHELHHALQIGNYGYWQDHTYFYEMTSTWMEDVLYPAVDDYLQYLFASWGHFRNPDRPFTSNELICYSRGIWGHYIAARFGRDMMRTMWEQIRTAIPITAMDRALRTRDSDVAAAFAEWSLWNHFTGARSVPAKYYPDAADYPTMILPPVEYAPPSRTLPGTLEPLSGRSYDLIRPPDTMTVILVNTDLAGAVNRDGPAAYTLEFRAARPDQSWHPTPIGLFCHLGVATSTAWSTWYVIGDTVRRNIDPASLVEGRAFPNPFIPGSHQRVALPVDGAGEVRASLQVYNSGMDLVYASAVEAATWYLDRQMFFWDGKDAEGRPAASGIYFFVLDTGDRRVRGKIALVRR